MCETTSKDKLLCVNVEVEKNQIHVSETRINDGFLCVNLDVQTDHFLIKLSVERFLYLGA